MTRSIGDIELKSKGVIARPSLKTVTVSSSNSSSISLITVYHKSNILNIAIKLKSLDMYCVGQFCNVHLSVTVYNSSTQQISEHFFRVFFPETNILFWISSCL